METFCIKNKKWLTKKEELYNNNNVKIRFKEYLNMKRDIVRLQNIKIRNLKNVGNGYVKFSSHNDKADILGIYGQNGSGKTTLVYAISVLKSLLMGKCLSRDFVNYIKSGEQFAGGKFEFSVINFLGNDYKIFYEFEIKRNEVDIEEHIDDEDENNYFATLVAEKLSLSKFENNKWTKTTPILYHTANSNEILPKNRFDMLTNKKQDQIDDIRVLKLLTAKEGRSFLFSREIRKIIDNSVWDDEYKLIFRVLNDYAIYNLHVFKSEDTGMINANIALPLSLVLKEKNKIAILKGCLNLDGISPIPKKYFGDIKAKMNSISLVLKEIIPGLTISLMEVETTIDNKGEEIVKSLVIARRDNVEIPLQYESDGVKKLVSILYCLILVFNDSSTTLVVDEFDSGIFEYLLGEILRVVEESGKGQLIFTSHNLRALEVLNYKNIMFTTTNEANRYIRFKNVKTNNNFRDVYFHDIVLGGQNECIYECTNPYMIARAFRLAGDEDGE